MSIYTPTDYVAKLKQEAYDIKKKTGQVHGHVLQELAKREGYKTWAALLAAQYGEKV